MANSLVTIKLLRKHHPEYNFKAVRETIPGEGGSYGPYKYVGRNPTNGRPVIVRVRTQSYGDGYMTRTWVDGFEFKFWLHQYARIKL